MTRREYGDIREVLQLNGLTDHEYLDERITLDNSLTILQYLDKQALNQVDNMTDTSDSEDTESANANDESYASGSEERKAHYPDSGYNKVEIDLGQPPGKALTKLRHRMKLSAITLYPATAFEDYVVYDCHGNGYAQETLDQPEADGDLPEADDLIEIAQSGETRERRVAMLQLAWRAKDNPSACLSIVPQLTALLQSGEPAIQAEALYVLALIAEEFPEQVTPAATEVIEFLTTESHRDVQNDAITFVKAVAEQNPNAVVDAVPKLGALLQGQPPDEEHAITALQHIGETHPDSVVPIAPQLVTYIEEGEEVHQVGALAVLGMLAKEYPNVAEETIPTASKFLDADNFKLRANATGLLADLADEYPDQVRSVVPQAIELLTHEDEKVRYNATSILARVAKAHPDEVQRGIDPLIDSLDDDFPYTRLNACWALGYLKAESGRDQLEELANHDPDDEVRNAAEYALSEINDA